MGSSRRNIESVFERLKDSIAIEDAHQFESTSLEDVWLAVREIEGSQRRRQCNQNIRRVEPLLRGMEKLGTAIDVLCNGTPFLPYAWAPIKFLLKIASQYRDIFEALVSAYAKIGSALPRLDRYAEAFKDNAEFQKGLATVCGSIVDFHIEAYQLLNKRGWHILFLSLWRDYESRFSGIVSNLQVQRDFIDGEAASFHILETKLEQERAQEATRIAQLQHAVAWLSIDDKDQEIEYERLCSRRHEETCRWITSERQMKEWTKDNTKNPVLWLNGKPGAGKSVMCSYTVRFLKRMRGLVTCYYFCNSKDPTNICDQVLRTIALQLLRSNLDLASLIANQYVYCGVGCSMVQLRKLLPQMLQIVPQVRIVIDGIDECSKESQKSILKEIQSTCLSSLIKCKIIFSSRKDHYISEKLSGKPQISLDKREEVETDILLYVKHKMKRLPTSNKALIAKVEKILVEKANGMFLWVRLVVEELRYCFSESDIEERATALPRGLDQAYQRILQRIMIDEYTCNLSVRILEWMACSCRNLKSYEVLDGIAFRPGFPILTSKGKIDKAILDHCKPLIEDGPSNTLDFVHFSAKEYILKAKYHRDGSSFIHVENAYFNIAFSCVSYLNTCLDLISNEEIHRAELIVQGLHGLQLYANQYWHRHFITYASFCADNQLRISEDLMSQLSALLRLQKSKTGGKSLPLSSLAHATPNLEILNQAPSVRVFISELTSFKESLSRENLADRSTKSTEKTPLDSCDKDPTHLSTIRSNYLSTSEALLSQHAHHMFPTIDQNELANFAETYGGSAFVCRILHCPFSTDGFSTSQQRDRHELLHRPKLRCGSTNCFSMGFSTRSQLNRHNEKYHPVEKDATSLVDAIRSLNIKSSPTQQAEKKVNALSNVTLQQNMPVKPEAPEPRQQIQHLIYQAINTETGPSRGWQNQVLIRERVGLVFNIIGNIRLVCQNQANPPPLTTIIKIAIKCEKEEYDTARDKAGYRAAIDLRLNQLLEKRKQNQAQMAEKRAFPQSSTVLPIGISQFTEINPQQRMLMDSRLPRPLFQAMNQEQRERVAALPPDKLDEIITKWNQQRGIQLGKQGEGQMAPAQQTSERQFSGSDAIDQLRYTDSVLQYPFVPKDSEPSKTSSHNPEYKGSNQVSSSSLPSSSGFNPAGFNFGPTVNATLYGQHQGPFTSNIIDVDPRVTFVCAGNLKSGGRWGCGTRFANKLELGEHFQSTVGKKCIRTPMDEDLLKQQELLANREQQLKLKNTESRPNAKFLKEDITGSLPFDGINIAAIKPRYRRKAYTGCKNCKNRRVKCDETRPQCVECVRSGRECGGFPAAAKLPSEAPTSNFLESTPPEHTTSFTAPPSDSRSIIGKTNYPNNTLSSSSAQEFSKNINADQVQLFGNNGDLGGMDFDLRFDLNPFTLSPPEKNFPEYPKERLIDTTALDSSLLQNNQDFGSSTNMPPFTRPPRHDGGISDRSVPGIRSGFTPDANGHLSGPLIEYDKHFGNEHDLYGNLSVPYEYDFRSDLTPRGGSSGFIQPNANSEVPEKLANGGSRPTILESRNTITNALGPVRNQLSRKRGHGSLKESYGNPYTEDRAGAS